ncbi:MAG TPA: GrpB family protein [Candidatus Thermoplasmatota archaeon]|nr:GrpB family protein [Candidatus Thermoplasmatota archaeon]
MLCGHLCPQVGRPVVVAPYDPAWPSIFETWKARIREALPDAVHVEHIGSTAVPACPAKPVVDILVTRQDQGNFDEWRAQLAPLGLTHARQDSTGMDEGQWFFRDPPRTVHVHVYPHGSAPHLRHIRFRDALRRDPALRDEYGRLKLALAAEPGITIDEYIARKGPFVRRVEAGA